MRRSCCLRRVMGLSVGVLTLRIPIAEQAKPRKIAISGTDDHKHIDA